MLLNYSCNMACTFFPEEDWKPPADLIKVLEGANQPVPSEGKISREEVANTLQLTAHYNQYKEFIIEVRGVEMFVEGGSGNGLVGIVFFELYTKDTCPYAEEVVDGNIKVHVGGCNSNSTEEEQFRVNLVNNAIRNKVTAAFWSC
ncbi:hypothetical protein Tco_0670412 [Tanacetum coccineum]